ncbi:mitochondrial carrier domain-containing protein [Durotheca rogersii]|uniref:mitochondrial carrier domain-containing protein n=1 Tax=Durotheca rogersii TaxID=419775 RepID=UPI00221F2ABB|nr:mitochondrial carrier domain-containing protein [Durotheca rogersii]KAI5863237.1 mitochondrial carrier domain-containing protein [Durotheca rogersii]
MSASSFYPSAGGLPTDTLLPALHHALSGSTGALISTCAIYPLSALASRLRSQPNPGGSTPSNTSPSGRAAADHADAEPYPGATEAFSRMLGSELGGGNGGGPKAYYAGLAQDAAKSVLDSFLFFLFYEWIRSARLASAARRAQARRARTPGLGALEELAIGLAAGACSRLLTTPAANVVARLRREAEAGRSASVHDVLDDMQHERGGLFGGLWSGYTADLALALNPSVTSALQELLGRHAAAPQTVFLVAAASKAAATLLTRPFEVARARMQSRGGQRESRPGSRRGRTYSRDDGRRSELSYSRAGDISPLTMPARAAGDGEEEEEELEELEQKLSGGFADEYYRGSMTASAAGDEVEAKLRREARRASTGRHHHHRRHHHRHHRGVLETMARMVRREGVGALYSGLGGALLRGVLGHGTAAVAKAAAHRVLFRLYLFVGGVLAELRARQAKRAAAAMLAAAPARTEPLPTALRYRLNTSRGYYAAANAGAAVSHGHGHGHGYGAAANPAPSPSAAGTNANRALKAVAQWRRRRSSSLEDFGVNVVANMIDGTQRKIR